MDATRCYSFDTPEAGVSLVALNHGYSHEPSSMIELRAASGAIRTVHHWSLSEQEWVDIVKAVGLSHAIQAETNRLEMMGGSVR